MSPDHADQGTDGVTVEQILKLTGVKSVKALRDIAEWTAPREALKPMRPIQKHLEDGTGWATGRYGAAALVAWIDQIKAGAKRS